MADECILASRHDRMLTVGCGHGQTRFRSDLAAAGPSLEQFDVLVHLAWAPSGALPLHELTASMVAGDAISRSGITLLLDRMTATG
jgi:hypothetical protein